jgi:hypothetical protein
MVEAQDIDRACELVDLVRLMTNWLFDWDNIWSDTEQMQLAASQTQNWLHRVTEIADTQPESLSA